ncbi:hypothetical protein ERO13_A01G130922v2 [Gossypium hirsutum]|uniref:Uncharacterized protein n=1 Tax=Gossypium darwinii TaxID=34276 RepID=A0A5D2HNV2_GOSDA|nr:hypothetical protein ERO13_A01G130922v2 [Gossypium hirsutum]KAG4214611.1 hypothetical protein ERO13_A01G130922v2 [Gossypium hirsutum]KAG4214612.1 hypothetical protein ERO13_A01G130922v2 [Gossypium hirsutum]TYH31096.1 hypothetical protein ES288_A01G146400v1 [Gossypium darwinii]
MLRFQICPLVLLVVCGSPSESLIPLPLHSVQVVYPDQEPRGTPPSQAKKLTTEYSPVDSPLQIVRSSCELKANGIHKILSASLSVKVL